MTRPSKRDADEHPFELAGTDFVPIPPRPDRDVSHLVAAFLEDPKSHHIREQLDDAFWEMQPAETLRPLLTSGNADLIEAATWWTVAVLWDVDSILTELCDLLDSEGLPRENVVESIQKQESLRADVLPRVLRHIDDDEEQIANDVVYFLSELTASQLTVLLEHAEEPLAGALAQHLGSPDIDLEATRFALAQRDVRLGRVAMAKVMRMLDQDDYDYPPPRLTADVEDLLYEIRDGPDPVAAQVAENGLFSVWTGNHLKPRRRRDNWRVRWWHLTQPGPSVGTFWISVKTQFNMFRNLDRADRLTRH